MTKYCLFFLSFLIYQNGFARSTCPGCSVDSIQQLLALPLEGEQRLEVLEMALEGIGDLGKSLELLAEMEQQYPQEWASSGIRKYHYLKKGLLAFRDNRPEEALQNLQTYVEAADQDRAIMGLESTLAFIRVVYWQLNAHEDKLGYYRKKLATYQNAGPPENKAICYHGIAGYYANKGNYNTAIGYYLRAAEVFESFSPSAYGNELAVIGHYYKKWGNPNKALNYFDQAIEWLVPLKNYEIICYSHINVSEILRSQAKYEAALSELFKGLNLIERVGIESNSKLSELKVLLLLEVGKTYLDLRQTNNSLRYLQAAEILGDAIKVNITGAYNEYEIDHSYARYYDQINEVQKAEQYLLMALEKARKAKDAPLLKKYYKALSLFYDANGDSRQASAYSLDYIGLSDSLALTNNVNAVAQYEMEKKDQEAQLQIEQLEEKRKRGLRNLLFLGLLSLFIAGGLYLRLRLIRESRARIQKEKDRSESLLLNILPYEVAEELKAKGRIAAREFREVSIIFSDFKGFTEAAGQMTAQKLVSEINTCYEAFDHIMDKYKIEKIKTIGDAYMAAGGLSVTFKDSVKHTVLAALEMQRFIIDRKHTVDGGGDDQPTFEMRVGVHTGPIVAGVVGVKKFQYDLWGDTVNIASRMESNGAINQVNVSQNTYELLRGDPVFNFRSRGKVAVKGKGEMEMYFVNLRMTPLLEV